MRQGLIIGGIPDTLEYYVLFHLALRFNGVWDLLYSMFEVMFEMVAMQIRLRLLGYILRNN